MTHDDIIDDKFVNSHLLRSQNIVFLHFSLFWGSSIVAKFFRRSQATMEPIRPISVKGESLSGYIMRTATENRTDIFGLIRELKTTHWLNEMTKYHQIDSNPYEKMDTNFIMQLTELKPDELSAMTYLPLYEKFIDESEYNINYFKSLLRNCVDLQHRRFCPDCLQQYSKQGKRGVYQLIWQVNDIKRCHIHHRPLTSICPNCGAIQPYITNWLGDYRCLECGGELFDVDNSSKDNVIFTSEDSWLYELWKYLLDSETKGMKKLPGSRFEVQMAITLLYFLNKNNNKGNAVIAPSMNKNERRKALLFIQNRDTNIFVTPYRLSTLLGKAHASVDDFFNTIVPEDFIELIMKRLDLSPNKLAKLEDKKTWEKPVQHKKDMGDVKRLARNYIQQRPRWNKSLTNKEVYSNISVSDSSVTTEVNIYISDLVKVYNKQQKEEVYQKIEKTAIELLKYGCKCTYKNIAEKVGVHIDFIKRNKEIIKRINNIRESNTNV